MSPRRTRRHISLNWGIVTPPLAGVLLAVGVGMLVCCVFALGYGDGGALAFGVPGAITTALGVLGLLAARRIEQAPLRARDGFFGVTMAWVVAALAGAVPFMLTGSLERPVDAVFESMSGFTGCGATLLGKLEVEPHAILLWRSLSHWIGGVGIVLLVVAIAPATGLASQRVFFAESSGPMTERLTPRIADTAKIIGGVYLTLSVLAGIAFLIAGMGPFDALNHAFATVATGGFSTRTASLGAFDSLAIELVAMSAMTLGGINLAFYWRVLRGRALWPQLAEVRAYLLILAGASVLVTASLLAAGDVEGLGPALRAASFAVVSVMTTSAFITDDFDLWNDFARLAIIGLGFVGACAGSTSGGMKVVRIMLLCKTAVQEVQRQLQPRAVQVLRMRGRVFSEDVRRTVLGFFCIYVAVWVAGTMVLAATGLDVVSAATGSAAALNLAGVGLGELGASENFGAVPSAGRWVLSFLMLVGRLEVFTVIALLTPAFWRRQWA